MRQSDAEIDTIALVLSGDDIGYDAAYRSPREKQA